MKNFYPNKKEINEAQLFEILKTNLLPDLEKNPEKFDRTDCTSQGSRLQIELKCRRTHYEELLIEKKKFDALIAIASLNCFNPCYINSTPEGIYGWNLSSIQIQWQIQEMPATTDFGNTNKVEKLVGFLPISKAIYLSGAVDF